MDKNLAMSLVNELLDNDVIDYITHTFARPDWPGITHISRRFRVSRGCYKIVFIFEDCDFVIKTDRVDDWYNGPSNNFGGCHDEYDIYQRICKDNMTEFFPETDFLMEADGYEFYIQERADIDEDRAEDEIYQSIRYSFEDDEEAQDYAYSGEVTLEDILYAIFGSDDGEKLSQYLSGLDITDIHSGNVGWRNGYPMIIDFAC